MNEITIIRCPFPYCYDFNGKKGITYYLFLQAEGKYPSLVKCDFELYSALTDTCYKTLEKYIRYDKYGRITDIENASVI